MKRFFFSFTSSLKLPWSNYRFKYWFQTSWVSRSEQRWIVYRLCTQTAPECTLKSLPCTFCHMFFRLRLLCAVSLSKQSFADMCNMGRKPLYPLFSHGTCAFSIVVSNSGLVESKRGNAIIGSASSCFGSVYQLGSCRFVCITASPIDITLEAIVRKLQMKWLN